MLVAQENVNSSIKHFVHGDHLGSSTVISNSSGSIVENTTYSPYGKIISGGRVSRYDYTRQEFDSVLQDYDYNARRYKNEWGIFTQSDIVIQNLFDPQILNHYSYARNNPYLFIDPDGRDIYFFGNYDDPSITGTPNNQYHIGLIIGQGNDYTLHSYDDTSQGNYNNYVELRGNSPDQLIKQYRKLTGSNYYKFLGVGFKTSATQDRLARERANVYKWSPYPYNNNDCDQFAKDVANYGGVPTPYVINNEGVRPKSLAFYSIIYNSIQSSFYQSSSKYRFALF